MQLCPIVQPPHWSFHANEASFVFSISSTRREDQVEEENKVCSGELKLGRL